MSVQIQLRGGKAVVAILALAGFAIFTRHNAIRTLDTAAVEAIKPWIIAQYTSAALRTDGGRSLEQMSRAEQEAYAARLLEAGRVEIKSIQARGMSDDIICRVEFLVNGKPPPDGKNVRFYRMRYSNLIGWTFQQETSELFYRFKLW